MQWPGRRKQEIETDTLESIKQRETDKLSRVKADSNQNYAIEIEKAEAEKAQTIADMEKQLEDIRSEYEKTKSENAKRVLESLFQSV